MPCRCPSLIQKSNAVAGMCMDMALTDLINPATWCGLVGLKRAIFGLWYFDPEEVAYMSRLAWNTSLMPSDWPLEGTSVVLQQKCWVSRWRKSVTNDAGVGSGDVKVEPDSSDESDSSSSASNSDFSSEDGSSQESDLDRFEEAFAEFGKLAQGLDDIEFDRGEAVSLVTMCQASSGWRIQHTTDAPKTWPLARMTLPLNGFSKQLERLLEGHCMEIIAANYPDQHVACVKQFAKDLVLLLAFHLKESRRSSARCWTIPPLAHAGKAVTSLDQPHGTSG